MEVGRTEDCPTKRYETECQQSGNGNRQAVVANLAKYGLADFMDGEPNAVQSSPNEEHQGTAVPDTGSQHRDKQTETSAHNPVSIASERDIEIVAEPGRERNVPSVPEIREVAAAIGEGKILAQTDAKHGCDTDADVAVTAEIQVDLHGEAKKSHQTFEAGESIWRREYPIVVLGNIVGDYGFLDDAQNDEPKP